MKNNSSKLVGILGTLIFHLVAAIIFVGFKMHSLNEELTKEFKVEIEQIAAPEITQGQLELPGSSIERILQGDEELLNIARNLANKSEEKIDPADYIDKVKEELINAGKLGPDNYIDEQKRLKTSAGDEKVEFVDNTKTVPEDKLKESRKMEANYQGPTRIYYDLAGRNHTYLPIPIYKCQGSGKVVLEIRVNQEGEVEEAKVIGEISSTSDPCLTETAIKSALISRFAPDINSPKIQTGTLTYEFVAQ